jgi:hypothetical protein
VRPVPDRQLLNFIVLADNMLTRYQEIVQAVFNVSRQEPNLI